MMMMMMIIIIIIIIILHQLITILNCLSFRSIAGFTIQESQIFKTTVVQITVHSHATIQFTPQLKGII